MCLIIINHIAIHNISSRVNIFIYFITFLQTKESNIHVVFKRFINETGDTTRRGLSEVPKNIHKLRTEQIIQKLYIHTVQAAGKNS